MFITKAVVIILCDLHFYLFKQMLSFQRHEEFFMPITPLITHWEKLLDSDWLRHSEFIHNLRANPVIRGKLQISMVKSVIHSECKCKKELTVNN